MRFPSHTGIANAQVMEKLPTFAPHMEAVELTNALWACGKLEIAHDGVFEQLIPILIKLCAARVPCGRLFLPIQGRCAVASYVCCSETLRCSS